MAAVIRYVDVDVVGGAGDGTSLANAYSSASAWEAAEETDLVTNGDTHEARCANTLGGTDSTALTIVGWTTGASNDITFTGHSGYEPTHIYSTANYHIATVNTTACIYNQENYVTISKVQLQITSNDTGTHYGISYYWQDAGNDLIIEKCIIKGVCSSTGTCFGIRVIDSDDISLIRNCIILDFKSGADTGFGGIRLDTPTDVDIINCTINGCYYGVTSGGGTIDALNLIVFENDNDFSGTFNSIDYCASDDGNGTNSIAPSGADWDNEFTDKDNDDFTIKNSGNVFEGSPITNADNSDVPTDDLIGTARNVGAEVRRALRLRQGFRSYSYGGLPA